MNYDDRKRLKKQIKEAYRLNDWLEPKAVYAYFLLPVRFVELAMRKTTFRARAIRYPMWRRKVLR